MNYPKELRYTKDHEWAKKEGDTLTIGITHHAVEALGEIVFVELPKVGRALKAGETFGVVESIKAVSDLYSPVDGVVTEVHADLPDQLALLSTDPHSSGWIMKIKPTNSNAYEKLLEASAYQELLSKT